MNQIVQISTPWRSEAIWSGRFGMVPDRGDYISLHDLHVIDVIKQAEIRASQLVTKRDAPAAEVAHVIGMVHLGIEKFHRNEDSVFLGGRNLFLIRDGKQYCLDFTNLAHKSIILRPGDWIQVEQKGIMDRWKGSDETVKKLME